MKATLRYLCAACIFTLCLIQTQAASTNGIQLTIELQDGSRVVGKAGDKKFEFRSDILGEIKLPLEQIGSIECQPKTNEVKLTAANGDKLAVTFLTSEIHIETSFGSVKIPVDSMRRLQVSAAGVSGRTRAGLVALWSGEGNANDSVGNCNGQLMNGVGFAPGKVGQAFDLNENFNNGFGVGSVYSGGLQSGRFNRSGGGGGFVLIPANPALDVGKGDGFTIACWIKPDAYTVNAGNGAGAPIIEWDSATQDGLDLWVYMGTLLGGIRNTNAATTVTLQSASGLLSTSSFQHVAFTYDKSSGLAVIYLNGTVVATSNFGSMTAQTACPLNIGRRTGQPYWGNSNFGGLIDELSLYNRALSTAEIQVICTEENNGQPLPPPSASNGQMPSGDSGF